MSKKHTKYTKELLEPIIKSSISWAEVARKLGLAAQGGNFMTLQRNAERFNISTDHMTNQAHNKGKHFVAFEDLKRSPSIKARLLQEHGHCCWNCHLSDWLGQPIPIELDHVDGNNRNNSRDNLRLLCCNCHALTPTFRNRQR